MQREIDNSARMGAEGFYLDAGWFARSADPKAAGPIGDPFDFSHGLGLWREDRGRFPSGINALRDRAHGQGLKFGLWMEPERVDIATSAAGGWNDRMLATADGHKGQPRAKYNMICLGCPEGREWVRQTVSRVVDEHQPDWLKWDNNIWMNCARNDHGHGAGDGNWAHMTGLYEVLAFLRNKYPRLVIENCASGGNRKDAGIAAHTHVSWMHDDSASPWLNRMHFFGTSWVFPAEYLNSWSIKLGDYAKPSAVPDHELTWIIRSQFPGACGLSLKTLDWSADDLARYGSRLREYGTVREYLRGSLYRHTAQALIYNKQWQVPTKWEVFEYRHPQKPRLMLLLFRDDSPEQEISIRLHESHLGKCRIEKSDCDAHYANGIVRARLPHPRSSGMVFLSTDGS